MADPFEYADEFGPAKIVHVHEPRLGLRGILVVDNTAAGPAIGGLRMAADASLSECVRLARAMSLKNAAAGLAHGGGKSVLIADPKCSPGRKEALVRAMARALADERGYIFGPDMGTDEACMGWVHDEIGRAVGLPRAIGGIPLDEIGATGFGLRHAVEVAAPFARVDLHGARVVIQGYGHVGRPAARFLAELGCVTVAVADSRGAVHAEAGLDLGRLDALKAEGRSVADYAEGGDAKQLTPEELVGVDCEIWVPAARPDVLRADNVDTLRAQLVVSGANIATTPEAEQKLQARGVVNVPDFIANAGGVICAAMEYHGASQAAALDAIAERVRSNTQRVLETAAREGVLPRQAAEELSRHRIRSAMATRRFTIF